MATQKVRPDPGALERQHRDQRWRVAKRKTAVYALVAGFVIVGVVVGLAALRSDEDSIIGVDPDPTTEGLPPTVEGLRGIWYEDPGTGTDSSINLFWFDTDGTFTWGGVVEHDTWVNGTYELDGHRITFTATGGFCGTGFVYTWDAGIVDDGRLEAVHRGVDSDSPANMGECTLPVGEPFDLTRVSPTSPAAANITPGVYLGGPVTGETTALDLEGLWLVEGTGHLLRLDFSGSYLLDDAGELATNPQDAGTVEIGPRTLTFVSGASARGCAEGDSMVWRRVGVEDGRIRATVGEDSCGRDLGGAVTLLFLNIDTP